LPAPALAKGFTSAEMLLTVLASNTSSVNVKLQIGSEKEIIEVQAGLSMGH
jgi:hypothetical protein